MMKKIKTKNKARIWKLVYVSSILIAFKIYNSILIDSDLIGYIVFGTIVVTSIIIGYCKHRKFSILLALEYIFDFGPIVSLIFLSSIYVPKYMINTENHTEVYELPLKRYDRRHRSFNNYYVVFEFKNETYYRWETGFTFNSKLLKNGTYDEDDCYITLKTISYLPYIYIIEDLIISKKE